MTKLFSLPEIVIDVNQRRLTEAFQIVHQSLKDAKDKDGKGAESLINDITKNADYASMILKCAMNTVSGGDPIQELKITTIAAFLLGRCYSIIEAQEREDMAENVAHHMRTSEGK